MVTAGGLIFLAAGPERTVLAYDKDTGKVLWEKALEVGPAAIPAVYEVAGREYVAFLGKASPRGAPETQGYYVFALPKTGTTPKK